jgi:hypothetical protein
MMGAHKPIYPSRATIDRLTAAYKENVGKIGGVEFAPDGTLRILGEGLAKPASSFDLDMAKYGSGTEG